MTTEVEAVPDPAVGCPVSVLRASVVFIIVSSAESIGRDVIPACERRIGVACSLHDVVVARTGEQSADFGVAFVVRDGCALAQ